jgi:hypothetical protein
MEIDELIYPYYIDQARLLDIYAVLFNGYSDYEEIQSTANVERTKSGKLSGSVYSGFKMLKIGGEAGRGLNEKKQAEKSSTTRRVQTTASILSTVIKTLKERNHIVGVENSKEGSFILEDIQPKLNSITSLLDESKELMKLSAQIERLGISAKQTTSSAKESAQQIEKMASMFHQLFDAEEIIDEERAYGLVGDIIEGNFYQSVRSDIIDTPMECLAQVKRVHLNGAQLLRNTVFAKLQGTDIKQPLIDSLVELTNNSGFTFEAAAPLLEITGKPVYEMQIIALFQESKAGDEKAAC